MRNYIPIFFLMISLSGCAGVDSARHEYLMRGQILEMKGGLAYLCVGSQEGARVGQDLNVYKFVKTTTHPKITGSHFKREKTGEVRITGIMDEHMATAKVISGEAKDNYIVELAP